MNRLEFSHYTNLATRKLHSEMRSITHFEDLSNEILFNIFDFLDGYHILEAFSNLNIRFEHIFNCPYFSLKLSIPFMSKSNFNKRSTSIIGPYTDRIISLHISQAFFIKYFFTSFPINSSFIRLESLTLDDLDVDDAISVLTNVMLLPRLFSLTIYFNDYVEEGHVIYQLIFRLPVLKFAKFLFGGGLGDILPFPLATNEHQQSKTLEHVVVNTLSSQASIYTLLSYTPQLRRLSVDWITFNENLRREQLIIPINLTHIFLNHWHLSFDEFELFISTVGSQLESLCVSIANEIASLNAHRWQQLILFHMPRLRTFIFDYYGPMIKDANGNNLCRTLLDQFSSPFWIERQWFFAHRHRRIFNLEEPSIAFYSTQSQWRKSCDIDEFLDNNICSYQDTVFNLALAHHVFMKSENVIANSSFQFSHVTNLTLMGNYIIDIHSFIDNLNRIIPLTYITYLNISCNERCLNTSAKLLSHMPNIHTLVLDAGSPFEMHFLSNTEVNTVDLVYNNNVIDVTITYPMQLDTAQLLMKLFPRMQCLHICETKENVVSIVRALLLKRIDNRHLFSLMFRDEDETIEQLRTMIDSEKLLDDYKIELSGSELCLWW